MTDIWNFLPLIEKSDLQIRMETPLISLLPLLMECQVNHFSLCDNYKRGYLIQSRVEWGPVFSEEIRVHVG